MIAWPTQISTAVNTEEKLRNRVEATVKLREKLSFKAIVRAIRKRTRVFVMKQGWQFENEIHFQSEFNVFSWVFFSL